MATPKFMGFSLTSPAPEGGDPTAKNRVWGFFGDAEQSHRENRPQTKQPRQGNRLTTTKIALGRTYWPSRDPIGEREGVNLYGMVGNDWIEKIDILGLVEAPSGGWEYVPVVVELQYAIHDFEKGEWGWGVVHLSLSVTDVFLVKSLATGIGKGAYKCGSHTWRRTRSWCGARAARAGDPLAYKTPVHHWFIHQNGSFVKRLSKHNIPDATIERFINQPWNLHPIKSTCKCIKLPTKGRLEVRILAPTP